MKSPVVTFICLRCGEDCFEDYCERWETQIRCYWCPSCEAEYPIFNQEVQE